MPGYPTITRITERIAVFALLLAAAGTPVFAEDAKPAPAKDATEAKSAPAPAKDAAPAKIEWRECDVRDGSGEVKKALIAECEKLVGDNEVKGFKYFQTSQTSTDAKDQAFKAEFRASGKSYVVTCSLTGEITGSEAKADPAAEPAKP